MNTQGHVMVGLALASEPNGKISRPNLWAAIGGGLIPDAALFAFVFTGIVAGWSPELMFGELYFRTDTIWFWGRAIGNSIPLWLVISILGFVLKRRWVWVLGLTGLLHVLTDLPLHYDDGHPHFWPFSLQLVSSPVSYWDVGHCALFWLPFEAAGMVGLALFVAWRAWAGSGAGRALRWALAVWGVLLTLSYLVLLWFSFVPYESAPFGAPACPLEGGFRWLDPRLDAASQLVEP